MKHALLLPLALCACVSTPVQDRIPQLLVGREVVYDVPDGVNPADARRQTWAADGTTVYDRGGTGLFSGKILGRWTVENGQYCAYFGSNTAKERDCWYVSTSDDGARIRFKKANLELIDFGPDEYNGRFVK